MYKNKRAHERKEKKPSSPIAMTPLFTWDGNGDRVPLLAKMIRSIFESILPRTTTFLAAQEDCRSSTQRLKRSVTGA